MRAEVLAGVNYRYLIRCLYCSNKYIEQISLGRLKSTKLYPFELTTVIVVLQMIFHN